MMADAAVRAEVLDPTRSFVVRAPAGSGKTTLLTRRLLRLLATVNEPEHVVAITFTRKAAEEMRTRILDALNKAREAPVGATDVDSVALARATLQHAEARGWQLSSQPSRLRILTIDALCQSIVRQAPLAAGLPGLPAVGDDSKDLYRQAARAAVASIAEQGPWREPLVRLLAHFDNDWQRLENDLGDMLGRRDQWLPLLGPGAAVELLREHHARSVAIELTRLRALLPGTLAERLVALGAAAAAHAGGGERALDLTALAALTTVPDATLADLASWQALAALVLVKDGGWRRKLTVNEGFPPARKADKDHALDLIGELATVARLRAQFERVRALPRVPFADGEQDTALALLKVLHLAAAQFIAAGARDGKVDHTAYALGALHALGDDEAPGELALALDHRIQHLLIDEFQDTSRTQYRLIELLTAGWSGDDGRTLFVVGDPMQSIYRFRQADVRWFVRMLANGRLGAIALERRELVVNFRAHAGLVDWINAAMASAVTDDADVSFVAQTALRAAQPMSVRWHALTARDDAGEAARVVEVVTALRAHAPQASIAILVRARAHIGHIASELLAQGHAVQAREIKLLGEMSEIRDLIALTRALLHPADRVAWFALLRAPWCGLRLATLQRLADAGGVLVDALCDPDVLADLEPDEGTRARCVGAVMRRALTTLSNTRLNEVVGATWRELGGPQGLSEPARYHDVRRYLLLLAELEELDPFVSANRLTERLAACYSSGSANDAHAIQVMTVHRAKGLEFDYVLIPGCGRRPRPDTKRLLLWRDEFDADDEPALMLAPSPRRGHSASYDYLHRCERGDTRFEAVRVLYVAVTRAREELHLFGHVAQDRDGEPKPDKGSFLAMVWPQLARSWVQPSIIAPRSEPAPERRLRRVRAMHATISAPASVPAPANVAVTAPEYLWVGITARLIGTVVHRLLEQARVSWTAEVARFARGQLRALGVPAVDSEHALAEVERAVRATLTSARGRWLFDPRHREQASEQTLWAVLADGPARLVIDRTFVDADEQRWIIDFKTGTHSGGALEAYLDTEVERYRGQLEHYARAMAALDSRPIMLGLYFPLLDGWREWRYGG